MITEIRVFGKQNKIILGRIRHCASLVGLLREFTVKYFYVTVIQGGPLSVSLPILYSNFGVYSEHVLC